jgi:hypothetical protein
MMPAGQQNAKTEPYETRGLKERKENKNIQIGGEVRIDILLRKQS